MSWKMLPWEKMTLKRDIEVQLQYVCSVMLFKVFPLPTGPVHVDTAWW